VSGQTVNATLWFDDISVAISTPDPDTTAPVFTGVLPTLSLLVGSTYNPLTGVTAFDVVDGDVTNKIVVEIFNSSNAKVDAVVTTAPAVFTVKYAVTDLAGNKAEAQTVVNVVNLVFKDENLLTNGSFATAIGSEWGYWQQDWGTPPVVIRSQDTTAGTYSLAITGGGDAAWAIQFFQENVNLVEGTTYRFSVKGSATTARKISVGIGYGDPFIEYGRKNGIELGTTSSTQEFVFTVTKPNAATKVVLELGSQTDFANGTVTLEEVRLQRLDSAPLIANSNFSNSGWRGYGEPGNTKTTSGIVNGEFKMTVTEYAPFPQGWDTGATASSFHLQIVQDAESLTGIPGVSQFLALGKNKSYTLTFDAYASAAVELFPNLFSQNIWSNYIQSPNTTLTTSKQTFTKTILTSGDLNDTEKLAFEFGKGMPAIAANGTPISVYLDNVSIKEGTTEVTTIYNGNFETVLGGHSIDGAATMKHLGQSAEITVATLGAEAYQPHYFYMIPTLSAGKYELKIIVNSSVARDLRLNVILPDVGFASILEGGFKDFAVTQGTDVVYTLTFTTTTQLSNVKVELDFGTLGGTKTSLPGTFVLKQMLVYRNFNS
jgi:hypothetical protein